MKIKYYFRIMKSHRFHIHEEHKFKIVKLFVSNVLNFAQIALSFAAQTISHDILH